MAYIPPDSQWYLADLVMEFKIEDEERRVVHVNTLLIRAGSPEEAYTKALKFGHQGEHSYRNTDGCKVRVRFRGLRDLNVIHELLEDGAELAFIQTTARAEAKIAALVRKKRDLGLFQETRPLRGPNYMPANVAERLRQEIKGIV